MYTLNLVYPEKSHIPYRYIKYPDGQQSVNIAVEGFKKPSKIGLNYDNLTKTVQFDEPIEVQIASRFNSFQDFEKIACAVKALRRFKAGKIHLYIPYLLGGRSDRPFGSGDICYLSEIIAPLLNSLNLDSVLCVDPHSDVAQACIKNMQVVTNSYLVDMALKDLYGEPSKQRDARFNLLSPDAGAAKKINPLIKELGYAGKLLVCTKDRDLEKGTITGVNVSLLFNDISKDIVIVDDICDGGRTFVEIAKEIKSTVINNVLFRGEIHLIVTHGIFSAGFYDLYDYFTRIYCTNSVKDIEESISTRRGITSSAEFLTFVNLFDL